MFVWDVEKYIPAAQLEQTDAPDADEKVPDVHATQDEALVVAEYWPLLQFIQLIEPLCVWYEPLPQPEHDVDAVVEE